MEIGKIIKEQRIKKGLTQKELAELLKVSAQAVSKWERGGTPDILLLVPLAKALGISVSALSMYEQGNRIPRDEVKIRMAEYYGISIESLFLILFPTKREEEVKT